VVLHDREHDLVALPDLLHAVAVGDEVDRFGRRPREHDLLGARRVDEVRHLAPCRLELLGGPVGEEVEAAMDVGIVLGIGLLDGVEHRPRLLRRGAAVEIDELLPVDLGLKDRKVATNRLDVIGGGLPGDGFGLHGR
jgi:hypothetical protein